MLNSIRIAPFCVTLALVACIDVASNTAVAEDLVPDNSICLDASEYLANEPNICTEAFMFNAITCSVPSITVVEMPDVLDCDEQDCD